MDWLTIAFTSCWVSSDKASPTNSTEALAGAVNVPVLSKTTVSICAILSITPAFFRYNLALPKTLRVLPKVKGVDIASAQGQAMINTEVKAFNPLGRSVKLQNAKEANAINSTIKVNFPLMELAILSKECAFSLPKDSWFQRPVKYP